MDLEQLISILPENYATFDHNQIVKAYKYADAAHAGQVRASGQPFITHCAAVAGILAEMEVSPVLVIAGLLHDVVEFGNKSLSEIQNEFGEQVARFVDGVTKITHLPSIGYADQLNPHFEETETGFAASSRRSEMIAETLRKAFLAMGDDIRVVLIKLVDRLHNMRTLGYMPEKARKKIAQETLDIFSPLANRLGIWQVKWELEDLGFRYYRPDEYREIAGKLAERRVDREKDIQNIQERLQAELKKNGIDAKISGRPKHIYSIYRKMQRKDKTFDLIRDLRGMRLIVADEAMCYRALGVVHMTWRPIPGEFDDYIAAKKDNNYQSLHTAVIYDDGKPLEIQIRTEDMHRNAEYGIAAHWRYKEDKALIKDDYQQKLNSLRSLMVWKQEIDDVPEFLDGMKSDAFKDRVYILTPKGDIIDLPAGSTPIDFAYNVHTELGHRCRGAKINGKLVTLDYSLKTGDQVEILSAKRGGPSRDWLNMNLGMVKTSRARSKIKQYFKLLDREKNLAQGKLLLEKEFKRLMIKDVDLSVLPAIFNLKTIDDLFVALGCGDIPIGRVVNHVAELNRDKLEEEFVLSAPTAPEVTYTFNVLGNKGVEK